MLSLALFLTLFVDLRRRVTSSLGRRGNWRIHSSIRNGRKTAASPTRIVVERLRVAVRGRVIIVDRYEVLLVRVARSPASSHHTIDTTGFATGNGSLLFVKLEKGTTEHD